MPEAPDSLLVLTKLRLPSARRGNLSRLHLIERLSPPANPGLVLVCAPAGYGKTTFLIEWANQLRQNGETVAWYALDAGDDTPAVFGAYLITSLIQVLGSAPALSEAVQLLRSAAEIDLNRTLPALINAVAGSEHSCWLFVDDYQLVSNPAIHTAIAYLIEHRPENLHLVLGTRSDPALPLARLRARRQLFEIRAAQLRFTLDETAHFLIDVMQLRLNAQAITLLEERTEGWVAGLQLAALSLTGQPDASAALAVSFSGNQRYLVEYLLEEVLNRQPLEVQAFLLSTSILERLSGPLCDALRLASGTTWGASQEILETLERSNLFLVALDDEQCWYRYHHLFRGFLLARLKKLRPERVAGLYRAASAWLAGNDFLREAVWNAFQAGDWEYAAGLVEAHSFALMMRSELATLREWCAAFPEAVLQAHPRLCVLQGWVLVLGFHAHHREKVKQRLLQAEHMAAALGDSTLSEEIFSQAAMIRTYLAMLPDPALDPRQQLDKAQAALNVYPEDNAGRFSALLVIGYAHLALQDAKVAATVLETARSIARCEGLYFGVVESSFQLARLAHQQGKLLQVAEICRQAQDDIAQMLPNSEATLPALGSLEIAQGCVLLEQNNLPDAEQRLLHGLALTGWGMHPYYPMAAALALFRLRQIQGRLDEAAEYLERLEASWPDIAFCTQALRLVSALRADPDDPAVHLEAAAWSESLPPLLKRALEATAYPAGLGPLGAAEFVYQAALAWAGIQIGLGNPQAVLPYLERQLTLAREMDLVVRSVDLSLLQAQAYHLLDGQEDRVWRALKLALELAQPTGLVRVFDQGPGLTGLLTQALGEGIFPEFVQRILAAIKAPGMAAVAQSSGPITLPLGEHLSERELEVLRLMASGASNQEIAVQLVITVGTVKSHINHILGKLGAHNRTGAVALARAAGLLAP